MAHAENCPKCKTTFGKALKKEFGAVTKEWNSGWPCRLEDVIALGEIKKPAKQILAKIYRALQNHRGHKSFVRRSNLQSCDFYIKSLNCIIEFDESQHFTAPRGLTLELYPRKANLGFDKSDWLSRCQSLNRRDNDPAFRDEQRAWYDTLRDLLPAYMGMGPTIRVFSKQMIWCEESTKNIRQMLKQNLAN